jgi:hypothetical protein
MDAKSNKQTVAALRGRQAAIAGEIRATRSDLRQSYAAIEATVNLFDPEAVKHRARPKRPYTQVRLFGGGKLSCLVLDALRVSEGAMTTPEIVSAVVAALGYAEEATQAITDRVPATLSYMARTRGSIVRQGEGRAAKWSLASTYGQIGNHVIQPQSGMIRKCARLAG